MLQRPGLELAVFAPWRGEHKRDEDAATGGNRMLPHDRRNDGDGAEPSRAAAASARASARAAYRHARVRLACGAIPRGGACAAIRCPCGAVAGAAIQSTRSSGPATIRSRS